ncbi:MAG: homoserine dehydrogenase [Gammaproteobacteria bacterium]|nr:homoserine dehydrogenase [Gammaproteobacteria bacterium]
MKSLKVGLLGLGTVGCGTLELLRNNAALITDRSGCQIQVIHASARNPNRPRAADTRNILLTDNPFEVVNNAEVDVVLELIGGSTIAFDLAAQAIKSGKPVITANKALIAERGAELFDLARAHNVPLLFEAAVAGSIPIIKALREGLAANRIEWLTGIINGTSNFILSEMGEKSRPFDAVLAEAQALGYAEADPTFDIEGIDAAHKLAILAAIAFGIPLQFERVYTEGISHITDRDITYAEGLGYRIKHLALAKQTPDGIEMRVHPTLLPVQQLLANVSGVMNAVEVKGDAAGPTLYCGAGAGAEATASAVVADLIDCSRLLDSSPTQRVADLGTRRDQAIPILPMGEIETAYYLRMQVDDRPGVLAEVARILAELGISIEAIQQKEPAPSEAEAEIILLTHRVRERAMEQALTEIEALASVHGPAIRIRLEHLDN